MADEFIKGLGIFTGSGLAWMVLAGWYRTSSFESSKQLVEPIAVHGGNMFNSLGVMLMSVFFWLALLGPLAFWVVIPAIHQAREAYQNRNAE
ncbi:MAG: hypothetical protein ABEJ28_10960 [Salinigranum sp.]